MDFDSILLAKVLNGGGGGGEATLIDKNISSNGTYNASSDSADGYKKVVVSVPNTYVAGDEGKVVSNGALVSQTSATYTANNTYDTTLVDSVTVNVSGDGSLKVGYPLTLMNGTGVVLDTDHKIYVDTSSFYKNRRSLWLTDGDENVGWYLDLHTKGMLSNTFVIKKPDSATKISVLCGATCQIYINELTESNGQTASGWLDITADTTFTFNLQNTTKKLLINFRYDSSNHDFDGDRILNKVEVNFQ